ncbi:MAG: InlB B-repeat-containing protein [Oscillospiraceae bacterium]|nr:InlB B-repeat-containing protein [Oscillospiraceae bacterium]
MLTKRKLALLLALVMCVGLLPASPMSQVLVFTASADEAEPITVEFYYNYTGAPAARPASFTKLTGDDGKLESFPVEQTLPSVGSRADWGFVGWYRDAAGTGEKVTLDTVFTEDTQLYAKWEQVPALWKEYEGYFYMGAFADFSSTSTQMLKHYNINCPSNSFKLDSQIGSSNTASTSRTAYTAAVNAINANTTMTEEEKAAAIQLANEDVRLATTRSVVTMLNNMRTYNQNNPNNKKVTRFHTVAWHGGQQPKYFFTNGFTYTNDATSDALTLSNPGAPGSWASRETMKARLHNYIKALVEAYKPYEDIIVSWDIVNEPVDDFTGQIRNRTDSNSQRGDWGNIWHDFYPALNDDGTRKYTTTKDAMNVIDDHERLMDESEWMLSAVESAAYWFDYYDCDWAMYINDYMDSNKPYTKLQPTLDVVKNIHDNADLKGKKLVYGFQGRLAWAYPTRDMLQKQVNDALAVADMIGVTEGDIRSDFEPNPFYDPTKPTEPVSWMIAETPARYPVPKWTANDLGSGSGSNTNPTPSTLTNTFDAHNGPTRRIPEWGTGNGMGTAAAPIGSERYNATAMLAISESIMKLQADFAADWMDMLIEHADRVELFQWDGTTDSSTFNSNKGAHLWVSNVVGRTGTFEKYSFFAVIGAPNRDKLKKAIAAGPSLEDAALYASRPEVWAKYATVLEKAIPLVTKRIYTLEGVNDVKEATAAVLGATEDLLNNPVAINFYYNYTGAPARPASFINRVTLGNGKLESFPVEQTLPGDGSRADYGFVGWYRNAAGTGEKVTLDTVFTEDTELYAKWEQVPSLHGEFDGYFLMGTFADYSQTAQQNKHYNVLCPSNNFKLTNMINTTAMRNNFVAARTSILANTTMTDTEKEAALQKAAEQVVLVASPAVTTHLNRLRAWNEANPNDKKYTRFHTVCWHGGQQPNQFFTNGFSFTSEANSASLVASADLRVAAQDNAYANRETMKARLDNYVRLVMERYADYSDVIISWDIVNEPVDDFTAQIRNRTDANSQAGGQWGRTWHDSYPARFLDGTLKYTTPKNEIAVVYDQDRLFDESEWYRWVFESAAKWTKENGLNWGLYVNDYMDSNKPYTKLPATLDITQWVNDNVALQGVPLGWGMQGRLAWAYPTIDMLRKQVEDGLEFCDQMGVSEGDIRSDFEPNPFYDPTKPTEAVSLMMSEDPPRRPIPKWNANDLGSGSGSDTNPAPGLLTNTFDAHNGTSRRMPEWNTGAGLVRVDVDRMNGEWRIASNNELFSISEQIMKNQADFAADWMDILVDNAGKVEFFQWDGSSDSSTFNSSKGAHLWVSNVTGRTGTFEKYSFFAVIGSPARNKLKTAINAFPESYWNGASEETLTEAEALLGKRIYTLEGVNDVKAMTATLTTALAALDNVYITYDANKGTGSAVTEQYAPGTAVTAKAPSAVGISRAGYTLSGWTTSANGIGVVYAPGDPIPTDVSVRLYAQWKASPAEYTVAFESYNNGAGATRINTEIPAISVPSGGKVVKPSDPVRAGAKFIGWYRDMALTNAWDFENDTVTENMRLYAKWAGISLMYGSNVAYGMTPGRTLTAWYEDDVSDESQQTMYVALYDAGGRLVRIESGNGVIDDGEINIAVNYAIPSNTPAGYYIKVFVWDADTFIPLCDSLTLE